MDKETNSQGSQYRRIKLPVEKDNIDKFLGIIDEFYMMIQEGKILTPEPGKEYGLYYADEMARHDRSMLYFRQLLDDSKFSFLLRLDENLKGDDRPFKIERGRVAQDAKKAGIQFLPEKRGDDGFIAFGSENIVVDWEIRRDWVMNHNNIPIRYIQRKKCPKCGGRVVEKVVDNKPRFVCRALNEPLPGMGRRRKLEVEDLRLLQLFAALCPVEDLYL